MKLNVNSHVTLIHIWFKFHEVLIIGYYFWLILWNLHGFKGYNLCNTLTSLMKLYVHQRLTEIYIYFKFHEIYFKFHEIYFKFHEIWFTVYLVIANYLDFKSIQGL